MFKNDKCKKCGIDGHMEWQCEWIRNDYPYMISAFEKMAHASNNSNTNDNSNSNDNSNTNSSNDDTKIKNEDNDYNSVNTIINNDKFYHN